MYILMCTCILDVHIDVYILDVHMDVCVLDVHMDVCVLDVHNVCVLDVRTYGCACVYDIYT